MSQLFPGADRGNYFAAGLIRIAAQSCLCETMMKSCSISGSAKQPIKLCSGHSPASGSTVRSEVTKLDGKSPTPLWFSPFHQLASLANRERLQNSGLSTARDVFGVFTENMRFRHFWWFFSKTL